MSKKYNEEFFDNVFESNLQKDYSNNTGKIGMRDKKISQILSEYGVNGKTCLDIGPGTGRWLQFIKNMNPSNLVAIDISDVVLTNLENVCNSTHKIDVETDRFPFDDSKFDIIISFMILEHLRNPTNFLSEIIRISNHGALVLMTIPNILSFYSRIRMLLGLLPLAITSNPTHVKFYNKKSLKSLFANYHQNPVIIPTSFSVNPWNLKSLRLPSNRYTSSLDDHTLFTCIINK